MVKSTGSQKREWDEASFFAKLEERGYKKEIDTARKLFNWATERHLRFSWGRGAFDGSCFFMLDHDEVNHYTFCIWTGGKEAYIQLQFAQLKGKFELIQNRRELADRIQNATGIVIKDASLTKYPGVKLGVLTEKHLSDFLASFDWYLDELKK